MRYPRDIRWPGRLQELLGDGYHVIEEGCNGRTAIFYDPEEGWKNGLDYLKPCLNSHKPVDIVILMLGTNDLKEMFHATAEKIAEGAGILVRTIQDFLIVKQGIIPEIILVSPPEIGVGIKDSAFSDSFGDNAGKQSKEFSKWYRKIAERYHCIFFDAAQYVIPSESDSVHLTPEGHRILAEELCHVVKRTGVEH